MALFDGFTVYGSLHSVDPLNTSSSDSGDSGVFVNRNVENIIHGKEGKMFVGGVSQQTSVNSLRSYFLQFGDIEGCTIMRDSKSGLSRGFAFVTFENPASIQMVLAIENHYLDGKKIDPQAAIRNISPARSIHTTHKKLFIGGVSQKTSVEHLKAYFSTNFGEVEDCVLKSDYPKNQHRGFGFITFVDPTIADRVCGVRYHLIHEKTVETKQAQKKEFVNLNTNHAEAASNHQDKLSPEQLYELYGLISDIQPSTNSSYYDLITSTASTTFEQPDDLIIRVEPEFRNRLAMKYNTPYY